VADPAVVIAMQGFKQGLVARDAAQMQEMARRWLGVERALEGQIAALAQEMASEREAGRAASRAALYRMERYQRLLGQAREEIARYADWAAEFVTDGQAELARMGVEQAGQAIQLSYWPQSSVGVYFDRLPVEAVEAMAGIAGNGRPVGELLRLRMVRDASGQVLPGVWDGLTQSLIDGTALGWNPRKTARKMADDLAQGLQKALVIARTEQLRVYRMASLEQYRASGVVTGQKRLAAHDSRTCAACIADDGALYPLDAVISDHPNGRCTSVPVVKGMPEVSWLSGLDWFSQQDPQTQAEILGPGRFEAWEAGAFAFGDLVTRQSDATWGDSIVPTPLGALLN
jgi:SPP1 gp7 family putative phage head morphogenesis protein